MNYSIRISRRAKHVHLYLTLQRGLEVVVPRGFDIHQIPQIIRDKQRWIERTTARLHRQREVLATRYPEPLPKQIILRALNEQWQVYYRTSEPTPRACSGEPLVILDSDPADLANCKQLLREWLRYKARSQLVPMLRELSLIYSLPYAQTSVRGQTTVWASCSAKQNISINYKLLFLPWELVRYVFIHELCHTCHLDHSPKFWALVHSLQSDYKQMEQALRNAWQFMPPWVEE